MKITPDGERYVALAQGARLARPFHYRWLLPRLCGPEPTNWRAVQAGAAALLCGAALWYGGFGWRGLFVAVIPAGLAGVIPFHLRYPVLVDLPAMAVALLAAAAAKHDVWWLAIVAVLIAGTIKETSPVFAALWAWTPILLVGLVPVAIRALQKPGDDVLDDENRWVLDHPIRASRKYHRHLPPAVWVLPWGACLFGFADPTVALLATIVVGYGQCAIATDTVRLYQWAWPPLAVAAAGQIPPRFFLPVLLIHFVNPFATRGG